MRISANFLLNNVAGRNIVVPVGKAALDFNAMLTVNETGAFLFSLLQQNDMTEEQLVEAVTAEYDVSKEQAAEDIKAFCEKMAAAGITE